MLKQRIITALVLAPTALAGIIWLPPLPFAIFMGIIICASAWEWARLAGLEGLQRWAYAAVLAIILAAIYLLPHSLKLWLLWLALPVWLINIVLVVGYPDSTRYWRLRSIRAVMGLVMLAPAWLAINMLSDMAVGTYLILLLLFSVWVADIGAYFSGRAWGDRKLAAHVSPGKTWAGVYGGVAAALSVTWLFAAIFGILEPGNLLHWVWFGALGLLTATISVIGDLTESMFKRYAGVKDSSQLLPGHGGVLDRLDSVIAALPFFTLMVIQMNL